MASTTEINSYVFKHGVGRQEAKRELELLEVKEAIRRLQADPELCDVLEQIVNIIEDRTS